jgi:hypothetical protein
MPGRVPARGASYHTPALAGGVRQLERAVQRQPSQAAPCASGPGKDAAVRHSAVLVLVGGADATDSRLQTRGDSLEPAPCDGSVREVALGHGSGSD